MRFEKRPKAIKHAIENTDIEFLSAAGRKGAEIVNSKKQRERERKEIYELQSEIAVEERALADAKLRESANEHIISPDGEDLDYAPNQ